jgi:hypothetical protein
LNFPKIAWINAAYHCFLHNFRLNFSVTKVKAIEASIVNFLPRLDDQDRKRWQGLLEAIGRTHESNIEQGVSGESVRIGIESLRSVELEQEEASGMIVDEGGADDPIREGSGDEEESDGSGGASPVRRSSRRSIKAEKARALEGDVGDDEDEDDKEGEDGEGDDGKGSHEDKEPREKLKKGYMVYDPARHFYWAKTVRRVLFSCFLY